MQILLISFIALYWVKTPIIQQNPLIIGSLPAERVAPIFKILALLGNFTV